MRPLPPNQPTRARWLDVSALTDPSRCPACAAPLAGTTCRACGLDVAGPRGRELWDLSQEVVGTLAARAELIAQMRTPARSSPARPLAPPAALSSPPSLPRSAPPVAPPVAPPFAPPRPTPARTGWAMQTILLVLGATLLAGAGLVFTVFAWGQLPLAARGVILAGIAAAVFAGAHRAARANLRSSAEAIGALGSALVVLVAWVLWAAVLPDDVDGTVTMASALLVAAVVLVPVGRVLGIATPSVVGLVGLTLAPAVLAAGTTSLPLASLLLALSAALCLVGQHPLITPSTASAPSAPSVVSTGSVTASPAPVTLGHARSVLTALAPVYLALAAFVAAAGLVSRGPEQTLAPLAGIALVSALWAWVCATAPSGRAWSAVTGTTLALLGATGAAALDGMPRLALLWLLPVGAAVGVAATVGLLRALPRLEASAARAAWVVFLVAGILPVGMTVLTVVRVLSTTQVPPGPLVRLDVLQVLAGLVAVAAAAPLLHLLGGRVITAQAPTPAAPSLTSSAPPGSPTSAPFPTSGPLPVYPRYPAPVAAAPRPRGAFSTHPFGVSVVAATVALLGLPLLMPDAVWAASTWLALAALVCVTSTRLPAPALAPAAAPVPPDRLPTLALRCAQAFCAAAVATATVLSFSLAAGADASVTGEAGRALVAASFAVAGLVLWVARTWVPSGAGNRAALLFGSLVITSVGFAILVRLVVPWTSLGWYAAPLPLLLVLVAGAMPTALGRRPARPLGADQLAVLAAAAVLLVPGLVAGLSIAVTATSADAGQPLGSSLLAATVLVAAIVATWQLGFAAPPPAQAWVRTAAGAAAPVLAVLLLLSLRPITLALDVPLGDLDWALAVLGLLAVLLTFAGARRSLVGPAWLACEVAVIALAVVTTVVVVTTGGSTRVSTALMICAAGTLAYAVVSGRPRWGWLALALAVCASWVSLAGTGVPPEAYTAPGGLVVVVVGLWQLVASLRVDRSPENPLRVLVAGLVVLILPTVLLAPSSTTEVRAVIVAVAVVCLGTTAHLLTLSSRPTLRPLTLALAVLALVAAAVGLGGRAVALAAQVAGRVSGQLADQLAGGSSGLDPVTQQLVLTLVLWTAVAVGGTGLLAVHVARTWFPRTAPVSPRPAVLVGDPRVWAVTVCTLLATAPVGVLVARGSFDTATGWVAGALVAAWGAVALLGTPPGAPRVRSHLEFALRAAPAVAGAYAAVLLSASVLAASGTGPESVTGHGAFFALMTLAGAFVALVTVRAAQVAPSSSTWRTVSAGALATIVPPTLAMFADPNGWWIAVAMLVAAGWLVLGVTRHWQAPVACGGVALAVQTVVLAGPPALAALSGIPGWIVLAGVGGVLLTLGLTFERQVTTARTVLRRYSELR